MDTRTAEKALSGLMIASAACLPLGALASRTAAQVLSERYAAAMLGKALPLFTEMVLARFSQSILFLLAPTVLGIALGAVGLVSVHGCHREAPMTRVLQVALALAGPLCVVAMFGLLLLAAVFPLVVQTPLLKAD